MSTLITFLPGALMVVFLMGWILKRDACHWQYLQETYGARLNNPLSEKLGHLILYGKFPVSKSYNGMVKVGAHRDGISLRIFFPVVSYFCKPMFIPFEDIKGWKQNWFLNAESVELELENAPEVKLVMPRDQLEWITEVSGEPMDVSKAMSPNNDKPLLWYYFNLSFGIFAPVFLVALLFFKSFNN